MPELLLHMCKIIMAGESVFWETCRTAQVEYVLAACKDNDRHAPKSDEETFNEYTNKYAVALLILLLPICLAKLELLELLTLHLQVNFAANRCSYVLPFMSMLSGHCNVAIA